ncbi:MAG: molybdopterin-binding protein, partial [Anaerolineae bacterium]|nr:molybdopterin-binding protein [Anaerolineae bacterium]
GGQVERLEIIKDDFKLIRKQVEKAAKKHDLVLVNAGSSAGEEDFTARVIAELGEVLVHGVAVRPGHPVILGIVDGTGGDVVPVIGVPGYPVSAALTGELFVKPLLERWLGKAPEMEGTVKARLTAKLNSPAGDDDYVRVSLAKVGEYILAAPLKRGAGVISSLTRADGLALVPRGSQGKAAGAEVEVRLLRKREELEGAIIASGSHDMTLDLMAQFLGQQGIRLSSSNVGSLGGLLALKRGQAHLAGSHLLDPATGEYNQAYIKEHLAGIPVKLVGLVERQQGLMTLKSNPIKIGGLGDLANEEVRFVNRQRGAGTRVLLDYELNRIGIAASQVEGYNREEFTHLGAAAAVASGRADCTLGIAAAAEALDLEFLPLYKERYDLVIPQEHWEHASIQALLGLFSKDEFREAVQMLPGYDLSPIGEISDITE